MPGIGNLLGHLEDLQRDPQVELRVRAIEVHGDEVTVTLEDGSVHSAPASASGDEVARLFGYAIHTRVPHRIDTTPDADVQWPQLHYWLAVLEDHLTEMGLAYERIERHGDSAHIVVTDHARHGRWTVDLGSEIAPDIADDIATVWHTDPAPAALLFLD